MSDQPLLVAPRPVRLGGVVVGRTHAHSAHDRLLTNASPLDDFKLTLFSDSSSDKDSLSPRSSPRSGLPSEALEEFLSILRPSFFPPTSPVLRSRRQAASLPAYPQDRSLTFQARNRLELLSETTNISDDMDISRSQQPSRNSICLTPDPMNEDEAHLDIDSDNFPFRWYKSNPLCKLTLPLNSVIYQLMNDRSFSHLANSYS
ncbi:hypothetical protein C0989_004539 [Termitomyces sp. Mn162]|nr:hypothetical protein C0989_004539 [Termitomyces sp. Mn162]